jgi:DNA-binding GntR family transcriptional regulator
MSTAPTAESPLGDRALPLSTLIYLELRRRIIEGEIKPGDRIRERELAEELNVSRIPLREALPRLESEGFVVTMPRRGAVVTQMTYRDVEELFEVRASLEVLAARLAAQSCREGASGDPLRVALDRAREALQTAADAEIAAANSEIHVEILRLADNRLLDSLMVPVTGRVRRLFRLEAERDQHVLCQEHQDLCNAVLAGNVELAASLAFAHVEHSKTESLELMREALPAD